MDVEMQISKQPKQQDPSHNATDRNQNPESVPVRESLYDLFPAGRSNRRHARGKFEDCYLTSTTEPTATYASHVVSPVEFSSLRDASERPDVAKPEGLDEGCTISWCGTGR